MKEICSSYFNCFSDLANYKTNNTQTNILVALKILSLPTVFIPLGFGIVYGLILLVDRIKVISNPSPQQNAINKIGLEKLCNPPKESLSRAKCPEQFEPFYQVSSKKFNDKIWQSSAYTESEKSLLFVAASRVYELDQKPIEPNSWVADTSIVTYLKWLALKFDCFISPLPFRETQYVDKLLTKSMTRIMNSLPKDLNQGPRIYGHPLYVNGNHHTLFIIDMANQTVEYFNSFGTDTTAKSPLLVLAKDLSDKYGVKFNYHHRTDNVCVQDDSYECAIWACKFIKERVEQGINFNPATCVGFNIHSYRNAVLKKNYQTTFYQLVGSGRFTNYCQETKIDKMKVGRLALARKIDLTLVLPQWGKENRIPPIIETLCHDTGRGRSGPS